MTSCFRVCAILVSLLIALTSQTDLVADQPAAIVFSDDFENGSGKWEILDPDTWKLSQSGENQTIEITERQSTYKPPHRSPFHVAIAKGIELDNFDITFRVRSTLDTGNHRDCCVFFGYQDAAHFYYVHLGAKPDPHSGQFMIVKDAARLALTENKKNVPWTDGWHTVRLVRNADTGATDVYFDDLTTPHLSVTDTTFGKGRIGIGSFDDRNEFDDVVIRQLESK